MFQTVIVKFIEGTVLIVVQLFDASEYRLDGWVQFLAGALEIFFFTTMCRITSQSTWYHIQWLQGLSSEVK
jgi:hypothetical protein